MKKQGVKRVNQTSGYVISKLTDQRIFAVHFKNTIMGTSKNSNIGI
jgi:hypothetical protein